MAVCQNLVPLVNIKIAGKWMFIPLKMVLIGIDPYPNGKIIQLNGGILQPMFDCQRVPGVASHLVFMAFTPIYIDIVRTTIYGINYIGYIWIIDVISILKLDL